MKEFEMTKFVIFRKEQVRNGSYGFKTIKNYFVERNEDFGIFANIFLPELSRATQFPSEELAQQWIKDHIWKPNHSKFFIEQI